MNFKKVKILDCTLRDGGYINNWEFGFDNIKQIIFNLSNAHLDIVECGFLKSIKYHKDKTLYNSVSQLVKFLPSNQKTKYCLMINYGDIKIDNIEYNNHSNIFLRLSFKKEKSDKALVFAKQLKEKNFEIFISPMHIHTYTKNELKKLINEINNIKPFAFSIVDTLGTLNNEDAVKTFINTDKFLDKDISICFHSHNNLNLSYSSAKAIIKQNLTRQLIIDSSLYGMGRGAGNLACEKITADYNNYDLEIIQNTIEKFIMPIYDKTSWGPSLPYFLSANYKLHPNYAKYVIDKNLPIEKIKEIFNLIPENAKEKFDIEVIKKIS